MDLRIGWYDYNQRRLGLQGGLQVGLRGDIGEYFKESKVSRWTQEELVRNGQGWLQLKFKEEYMTLQDYSIPYTTHNSKLKS